MRVHELTTVWDHDIADAVAGYLECALWSSTIDEAGETHGDEVYGIHEIDPQSRDLVEADIRAFVTSNYFDVVRYLRERPADYFGHDFWLTRNRHGAGFWDRGLGALGDRLTDAAHAYGESYVYAIDADTFGIQ